MSEYLNTTSDAGGFEPHEPPPWRAHWERKRLWRRRRRHNYAWLIAATLLFGGLTIGLRLYLRGSIFSSAPEQVRDATLNLASADAAVPEVQLQMLLGQRIPDEQLAARWGPGRVLSGGTGGELQLLYFENAGVYLLRQHEYIVYAGEKIP